MEAVENGPRDRRRRHEYHVRVPDAGDELVLAGGDGSYKLIIQVT
jgi:hypothetical protein